MIPGLIIILLVGAAVLYLGIRLVRLRKRTDFIPSSTDRTLITAAGIFCLCLGGILLFFSLLFLSDVLLVHLFRFFGILDK